MYIDKIIKKEVITLITSVGLLLIIFIGVSFASFFKIDEGENNVVQTGDLAISFCSDLSCDNTYQNMGQTIGTTKQDGSTIPESIFPYPNDGSYSNTTPYIFKVENTGSIEATITIKLNEDTDFLPTGDYSEFKRLTDLYGSHLKIAIRKRELVTGLEYQIGDVNMDGIVNYDDVKVLLDLASSGDATDEQLELGDVNNDGKINSADPVRLMDIINGVEKSSNDIIKATTISSFNELENDIIYTGDTLEAGESAIYFLWLYLDETTPNQAQSTYFVGNLDIQGQFLPENLPIAFSQNSWETIISDVSSGNTDKYTVGETKTIDLGDFGKHTVRIANNSTPSECEDADASQTACGFVIEFTDIITKHNMNSTDINTGGWPSSAMRTYLNENIFNALPEELQNAIIDTNVVSYDMSTTDTTYTSTDKLYLLSIYEMYSSEKDNATKEKTRQLDYYANSGGTANLAIKKYNGTASVWWTRTMLTGKKTFFPINTDGNPNNVQLIQFASAATKEYGVSPAFRIG